MTIEQIDKIRGNFVMENASFFREAIESIHEDVMTLASTAGSVFLLENNIRTNMPDFGKRHFKRAYDKMWMRTPVYFATESFKELSNTKSLADIDRPLEQARIGLSKRIQMVNSTTQAKYMSLIKQARQTSDDISVIAQFMDTSIRGAYTQMRAMQIARTETVYASNMGRRAGAMATGLPIIKTWVTMQDERVRESHQLTNGQQKRLSEPFNVNGELMMFPSDYSLGASASNVINCRCTEVYEIG